MTLDVTAISNCHKSFLVFTFNFWTFCHEPVTVFRLPISPPMNQVQLPNLFFFLTHDFIQSFIYSANSSWASRMYQTSGLEEWMLQRRSLPRQTQTCDINSDCDNWYSETQSRERDGERRTVRMLFWDTLSSGNGEHLSQEMNETWEGAVYGPGRILVFGGKVKRPVCLVERVKERGVMK